MLLDLNLGRLKVEEAFGNVINVCFSLETLLDQDLDRLRVGEIFGDVINVPFCLFFLRDTPEPGFR
jgi:hypothetical protein